ncbi:P-loop containing nucleoside triphosphate hydrolase protein [Xylariaceae sp. FL0662B]|nr:P-loop containing nucleoside triphosphate hydrolase protein [Xylariaceae sp. FL0662B]
MEGRKAIIVGISGASSSGKTTLARLLRDVFPQTFILHEDDFYRPENELPIRDGLLDWDCPEAIAIPDLVKALEYIRSDGTFPPFVDSKEDQNTIDACPIPADKIAAAKAKVAAWARPGQPGHAALHHGDDGGGLRLCILDGFLLYAQATAAVQAQLDVRLFLQVSRAQATRRRAARDGYVTLEGFWKDPPGYVDRIVWPNYVRAHAWLFEDGDVEGGRLDGRVLAANDILAQAGRGADVDLETTFEWAVDTLMAKLEELAAQR